MPLSLPVIPMTVDDFHTMRHRLGWKHEYWDGAARLSPSHIAVTTFSRPLNQRCGARPCLETGYEIQPVNAANEGAVVDLYVKAFESAVEFAGYSDDLYRDTLKSDVARFFEGTLQRNRNRGAVEHSYVVQHSTVIVAALLVGFRGETPCIEPVMVDPEHQLRGLATALINRTAESLLAAGFTTIQSHCHLANTSSLAWHRKNGFKESPCHLAACHYHEHYRRLVIHHDAAGRSEEATEVELLAQYWSRVKVQTEPVAISSVPLSSPQLPPLG